MTKESSKSNEKAIKVVRNYLAKLGGGYEEMGQKLGVSAKTVQRWHRGKTSPSYWKFCLLEDLVNGHRDGTDDKSDLDHDVFLY